MVEDTRPSDPNPVETLRRAAAELREDARLFPTDDFEFRLAVADWLDASAHQTESFGDVSAQALAAARAYLGESA